MWNFGDGNITTVMEPTVNHVYSVEGDYNVILTVIDSAGLEDDRTQSISVTAGLIGDLNDDGVVDVMDIYIAVAAYATSPGDPNWNPKADLNGDEFVDMRDIYIVIEHYGEGM